MLQETRERLGSESPAYFKKIQYICMVLGGVMAIVGGTLVSYASTATVGGVVLAVGSTIAAVGTFLAKLPKVDQNETEQK